MFPGSGGYPPQGGPGGGAGYPPGGYGQPGFDHPYPGNGGSPYPDGPGAAVPGFPGGAPGPTGPAAPGGPGYGPAPGQPYPGPSPMPGYAQDPRQQPQGWYAPPPNEARGPAGSPFPGGPGPAGPGPGGYAGPGGHPGQPGFPPGPGFAAPSHPGYRPGGGGYPGPGDQQPPYPDYQAWPPPGAPAGGYGYGEPVNGGGYAYVLHEDHPGPPGPPGPPRSRPRGQGLGEWAPTAGTAPGRAGGNGLRPADGATPPVTARAITAGGLSALGGPPPAANPAGAGTRSKPAPTARAATAAGLAGRTEEPAVPVGVGPAAPAEPAAVADPVVPYGPDDPAYGPPGPDWYKRESSEPGPPALPDDADPRPDEEAEHSVRGPFEPLRPADRDTAGLAVYQPADEDPDPADLPDLTDYEPFDYEVPEPLDFGPPSDPDAGPLGEVRDLYRTAETISPASLESNFDQLLEKQRQLISEYFKESGGVGMAEPLSADDSPVSLGFDTAESLAALRGDLRAP